MKKAYIKALVLDKVNNAPVVLLGIENTNKVVPIWIGPCEAYVLAMALEGMEAPRPLTHDLIYNFLDALDVRIEKVIIHTVKDNTFYANILVRDLSFVEEPGVDEDVEMEMGSPIFEIDARPSDSLILAVKRGIPIYVSDEIIEDHSVVLEESFDEAEKDEEEEKFKNFIENLDINAFRRMLDEKREEREDNPEDQ